MAKNGYLYDCLLPWQQSAIYSYEWKRNPRCVANLHCECQELKLKAETNSSFLVLHPSSGVHTVNTVGGHLNSGPFSVDLDKAVDILDNRRCRGESFPFRILKNSRRLYTELLLRWVSDAAFVASPSGNARKTSSMSISRLILPSSVTWMLMPLWEALEIFL